MDVKTEEQSTKRKRQKQKPGSFWTWAAASVLFRLVLIYFPKNLNPKISTSPLAPKSPLLSPASAAGYWLKQSSMSPYAVGNLLNILIGAAELKGNLIIFSADILNAMLIRATGQTLQVAYRQSLKSLDLDTTLESIEVLPSGDIAALVYPWNPFTMVACVGLSTSPIENFAIILALYGACKSLVPLAAFGWVITHLSLYPMILIIPMILLLGYGPDSPRKVLLLRRYGKVEDNSSSDSCQQQEKVINQSELPHVFSWRPVGLFLLWAIMWSAYVLFLCGVSAKQYGDLWEMFERLYGFILTVQDLSPNIGVLWYFFAEVFDFFRNFFLIVFQMNILFMIFPLAIRLKHQVSHFTLVGDSALYFGLLGWFVNELSGKAVEMRFSFCLFSVYVGISLLSPVMHNLWIWRGTGNANFLNFATAITYACLQIALVIESVSAMLNHDRKLRKLWNKKIHVDKS
ncbi:phosphatidylinositol glycan anchor biosynthesis class U protein-like [Pyrus ussuriensis x Pyrus communis]|uniref:Phosphatidylinositol glycan anchor biosynthesis class U protein-like n=1 Tax=Pyrus ussuriensis x Pyrus communis TaxID=2448454 RepID=A0A5N5H3Z9_9ROSA|nr:phosphatidylinositol glycan anchor biosynthesis class U protein-like [Pyrus ussuriensis x Pyrus communis]